MDKEKREQMEKALEAGQILYNLHAVAKLEKRTITISIQPDRILLKAGNLIMFSGMNFTEIIQKIRSK